MFTVLEVTLYLWQELIMEAVATPVYGLQSISSPKAPSFCMSGVWMMEESTILSTPPLSPSIMEVVILYVLNAELTRKYS